MTDVWISLLAIFDSSSFFFVHRISIMFHSSYIALLIAFCD